MATLADLQSQIADDLERTDLTTQIGRAIRYALKYHENERFWFNEAYKTTLSLSASSFTLTQPFIKIDRIRLQLTTGEIGLTPRDYAFIMSQQESGTIADPCYYGLFAELVQFDSAPSANKTLLVDGIQLLSTASAATDTTTWFNDPMVANCLRCRAKFDLYTNVIKDNEQASVALATESDALRKMRAKSNQRRATGYVVPTYF